MRASMTAETRALIPGATTEAFWCRGCRRVVVRSCARWATEPEWGYGGAEGRGPTTVHHPSAPSLCKATRPGLAKCLRSALPRRQRGGRLDRRAGWMQAMGGWAGWAGSRGQARRADGDALVFWQRRQRGQAVVLTTTVAWARPRSVLAGTARASTSRFHPPNAAPIHRIAPPPLQTAFSQTQPTSPQRFSSPSLHLCVSASLRLCHGRPHQSPSPSLSGLYPPARAPAPDA